MVDDLPDIGDVLPEGVVVDVQVIDGHRLVTTQSDSPLLGESGEGDHHE